MEKIYIVKYCYTPYDEDRIIFATTKKSKAIKYRAKFNRILKKWKEYYSQFEDNTYGIPWIKTEHIDKHCNRWNSLNGTSKCHWEEIEVR